MTREQAIEYFKRIKKGEIYLIHQNKLADTDYELCDMAIQALEYDDAKYHEEHGEVIVDKDVWEDAKKALEVVRNTDVTDTNVGKMDGDRAVSLIDRIKDLANAIEIDECNYWTPTRIVNQLKRWCENG